MQGLLIKRLLEFGKTRKNLYLLDLSFQYPKEFVGRDAATPKLDSPRCLSASKSFLISVKNNSDVRLWHLRLGHMPFLAMRNVCFSQLFPSHFDFTCNIYPLVRQTKLPSQSSEIENKNIFKLIHIDTWGRYKNITHVGYKYFLTIVDDYSREWEWYDLAML